jgi:DNA-binding GntR family transcriptional regulator
MKVPARERFDRGEHPSLRAAVYDALKRDVIDGRLAPGKSINIRELQLRFHVSLSAIREALCQLAADDLVIVEEQRGFWAAPVSARDLADLTPVRASIEADAIRDAVAHGDAAWDVRLRAAFADLLATRERVADDEIDARHEAYSRVHRVFHDLLVEPCTSPWTKRFRATLYDHSERYRRLAGSHGTARDIEGEHRAILDAVLARDAAAAADLLSAHVRRTAEILLHTGLVRDDVTQKVGTAC